MKTVSKWKNEKPQIPTASVWLLNDLAEYRGKQDLFAKQAPQKLKALREHALIESAVSSNRIEGVEVAQKRIGTVLFGKGHLQDRDEEEVRGYQKALSWIHEKGAKIPLSVETVLKLHKMTRPNLWDSGTFKKDDGEIIEKHPDGRVTLRFKPLSAKETPYRWLGGLGVRMEDETQQLYCMNRRFYSASLMRFLTRDPSGLDGGPNAYLYASANPLFFVDPSGLCPESSGSSSWGFNQNSFAGMDQLQQDYHNYNMQTDPAYYDRNTYAQSSFQYAPNTVSYAQSSYSYASGSFSYAAPSGPGTYQAFDNARIQMARGNVGGAIGSVVHESVGRATGFSDLNAFTGGYDPYTGSVSGGARLMRGVSGISQVAAFGFSAGMPALRTASAVATTASKAGGTAVNTYNWALYTPRGQYMTELAQVTFKTYMPSGMPPSPPPIQYALEWPPNPKFAGWFIGKTLNRAFPPEL